jgi:uncharacterized membrane protein
LSSQLSESYIAQIKQLVSDAERTDYIMPLWLPYFGAILTVIGVLAILIGFALGSEAAGVTALATFIILLIIADIIQLYVIYKWIARRNDHFERSQRLRSLILDYLRVKGLQDPELTTMTNVLEEVRFKEQRRGAVLWLLLYLIIGFIAWAYIMHFLTRDFAEHEHREHIFYRNLADILARRNIALMLPEKRIPDRNTILYVILTIITLGLFGLYWIYVVTKDPNEHFLEHRRFEPQLVDALAKL